LSPPSFSNICSIYRKAVRVGTGRVSPLDRKHRHSQACSQQRLNEHTISELADRLTN
jgi:hypothetical protein